MFFLNHLHIRPDYVQTSTYVPEIEIHFQYRRILLPFSLRPLTRDEPAGSSIIDARWSGATYQCSGTRATYLTRSPESSWPCAPSWPSSSPSSFYWPCSPCILWTLTRTTRSSGPSCRRTRARWASSRVAAAGASRRSWAASTPACSRRRCYRSSSSASTRTRWSHLVSAEATTKSTRTAGPTWSADSGSGWNSSRAARGSSCCSPRRRIRWSLSAARAVPR